MKKTLLAAFLLLILAGGAIILLRIGRPTPTYPYPGSRGGDPRPSRTEVVPVMGRIPIEITLDGVTAESEREHLRTARQEIERLTAVLDRTDPDSAVARLNRSAGAGAIDPGPELLELLKTALWLHETSGGAFDPTIAPLVSLWEGREDSAPPVAEEIETALGRVDAARILIDEEHGTARLEKTGMEIDLGALVRAYLVDRAVELLQERGVEGGIVRSGRIIRMIAAAETTPQAIDLQDPRAVSGGPVGSLWLRDGAVAVAGNSRIEGDTGRRRTALILDPRTGRPVEAILSAVVRAPQAVRAAGLATAVVVLGPGGGMNLIESLPGVEGLVLYQDASGLRRWVSAGLDEVEWMRPSALAGSWYEADPQVLRNDLNRYMERAERSLPDGKPVALISPHAGYRYSGQAAAYGYRALRGSRFDRVVVLGVSHRAPFSGASLPPASHYETPLGKIPIDAEARRRLLANPLFHTVSTAHEREHSIEIQLPFLQEVLGEFHLVPILFGQMQPEEFPRAAAAIREIWDENTLLVASTDFTHFGSRFRYQPFREMVLGNLRKLDAGAINAALRIDPIAFWDYYRETGITVCGRVPVAVLLHALPRQETRGTLLSYYTSAELSRDYENSVSYASILFTAGRGEPRLLEPTASGLEPVAPPGPRFVDEQAQRFLLRASRDTLTGFIRDGRTPELLQEGREPPELAGLSEPRGSFVTLTRRGRLRGCIGNIEPAGPLYRSVLENTIRAAVHDRRFQPVRPEELEEIEIEISVLGPSAEIPTPDDLLLGWQGVIMQKGDRRSVFLPEVAPKYGWSRSETLSRLSEKAGLPADAWRAGARLSVFETQNFLEDDFPDR